MSFADKVLFKFNPKAVIERSQFFDAKWYSEKYGIEKDPAGHYLNEGWKQEYNPSNRFSTKDYLINNPDISGINPLLHYEAFGKNEGRRPFVPKQDSVNDYQAEKIEIPYETYFEEIKNKKVISFDVFDTIINRPFVKTDETFDYLEKEYKADGFVIARKQAEINARNELHKEVNIDEIYEYIDNTYKSLKEKEIETEISFCHRNTIISPLYEKAKEEGKRVIATSDMYLPKEVVSRILNDSGYEIDEIYVSCEYNKTKGSGKLFDLVYEKEGIDAEDMIHFGDNYISDYSEARNSGTIAYQTPKIVDMALSDEDNKAYLDYYHIHDNLSSSIFISSISEYIVDNNDPFYTRLGYILGGPLVYSYLNFLCNDAKEKNIDELLFVSRDGFCLKEIYDRYFYDTYKIFSAYVYLSRASIYSTALENKLCEDLNKIISIKEAYDSEIDLEEWSKKQDENLGRHLNVISKGYSILATVDMFSGNYTSQKGAQYYLKDKIVTGYYAGNFEQSSLQHESFSKRLLGMADNLPVKMSEFLVTSYESPIIGTDEDGKPVYEYPQSDEKKKRYDQIMNGIYQYIDNQKRFFDTGKEYLLSLEEWIDLADAYLKNCSDEDIEHLSEIIDSENPVSGKDDKTISQLIKAYRQKGY